MKKKGDNIILYHGSSHIISKPEHGKGRYSNDYGLGFYCTEHAELAGEWACSLNADGYINRYSVNCSKLSVLDLQTVQYPVLNWLAILLEYRRVEIGTPLMQSAKDYICDKYYLDISGYDIVRGYRADDSYFSFVRAFASNSISLEQLSAAMHLGNLGEQIVIKSPEAFDGLKYLGSDSASAMEYYTKKKSRDADARENYQKITKTFDAKGIYVSQLISGEIGDDDERLR